MVCNSEKVLCLCGCGSEVRKGSKFISGHNLGIPGYWKNGMKGKHFSEETRRRMSEHRKGRPSWKKGLTMEGDARIKSSWNKGLPKEQQPGFGRPSFRKGIPRTLEEKEKISLGRKRSYKENPGSRSGVKNTFYGKKHSINARSIISAKNKKLWAEPEYAKKCMLSNSVGMNAKPNKPERRLTQILDINFPNTWKYVGDGQIWIGNRNPDFININGKKALIELFGDFWHAIPTKYNPDDALPAFGRARIAKDIWQRDNERIENFSKYGFVTLIVWESELKDEFSVISKISNFL